MYYATFPSDPHVYKALSSLAPVELFFKIKLESISDSRVAENSKTVSFFLTFLVKKMLFQA